MKNLAKKILVKHHCLIMEENEVTKVIAVINQHTKVYNGKDWAIGNCGWADEPTKWFMHVDASESAWEDIKADISKSKMKTVTEKLMKTVYEKI